MRSLIFALAMVAAGSAGAGTPDRFGLTPGKRAAFAACQQETAPLLSRIDALRERVPEDGEYPYTAAQQAKLATGAELKRLTVKLDTLRADYDRAFKDCEKRQWSKNQSTALGTSR